MAKSEPPPDVDLLLAKARNVSSSSCRVTVALNQLDDDTRTKVQSALTARRPGSATQWEYVGARLAEALNVLVPGADVSAGSVSGYRAKLRG